MVDLPEDIVFRTVFEERALLIAEILGPPEDDEDGPRRFGHLRSFDYTDPDKLTFTGLEADNGRPLVFVLTQAKRSETYVRRELPKAITAYDRAR